MGRNAALLSIPGSIILEACATTSTKAEIAAHRYLDFSSEDQLRLAKGLSFSRLISWNDPINAKEKFGSCNDFISYFPFENDQEGLLCVNHEYPLPLFVSGYANDSIPKTKAQVELEMDSVGVSVLHIKNENGWFVIRDSKFNRRITGKTKIPFAAGEKVLGSNAAIGTLGNCAGGKTPWGTYLTCEENFQDYFGESHYDAKGERSKSSKFTYQWDKYFNYPPEHYGWVVEIDPKAAKAKKLTALGRFSHEGATVTLTKDSRPVVYMGDDKANQFIYKFIGDSAGSLEKGILYVANTKTGNWLPLDRKKNKILERYFLNQTDLLIRAREAAELVGATPQDRPEDIEVCPKTGAVYISLTNNSEKKNYFGSILKIVEKNDDPLSMEFSSSEFLAGGEENGFACPDNLAFDPAGNLWITCDMPFDAKKNIPYKKFKNNGLFFVPMKGPDAGRAFLVATGPNESELTGPWFSPDGKTLFLSVQHPGEFTKDLSAPTSHWPDGGNAIPKSTVVAISGPFLEQALQL